MTENIEGCFRSGPPLAGPFLIGRPGPGLPISITESQILSRKRPFFLFRRARAFADTFSTVKPYFSKSVL